MAGVNVGTAYLEIIPSAKGFAGKLQGEVGTGMASAGKKAGSDAADGFGRSFKGGISNAAKAGALLLAGVAAGGAAFVKDSIGEARESQKVGALTTQVIKSTGGAAKVTADQVGNLATAISNKTGIDDEAVQAASNLLLTFTNVRNEVGKGNDVFNQATQAATDMGAALGGDPKTSAIQLGKALNDPVKGVTALSKVGVSFTAQQKDQIKTLVKSGNTLGAQKIILGELNKEFGGAAAASSTAGEKMATAFGNFKENIGTALLPALDRVEGFVTNLLPKVSQGISDFVAGLTLKDASDIGAPLEGLVGIGYKVRKVFKEITGGIKAFGAAWMANDGDVTSSGFPGLMERLANAARKVFGYLMTTAVPAVKNLIDQFKTGQGTGGQLRDSFTKIWDAAKKLWPSIKEIGKQLSTASKSGGVSMFDLLKAALAALPGILQTVAPLLESVAKWMGENKDVVAALVVALTTGLTAFRVITGVVKAYTVVQGLLNVVMAMNPIGLVVIAIAALASGLIYAYKNSETFRSYVSTAFSMVKIGALSLAKIVVTAFQFIANIWMTVVGALLDGAAKAFGWVPGIGPKLQGAATEFGKFKDSANTKLDQIKNDIDVNINTEAANLAIEALHREFLSNGWTVTAEVNTSMVYAGGGQLVPKARATGGPVSSGGLYAVGDNPDGSWNKTTELFVPHTSGTIMTQAQMAKSSTAADFDYDRLAFAMSRVQVNANVSPSALDRTMGARG